MGKSEDGRRKRPEYFFLAPYLPSPNSDRWCVPWQICSYKTAFPLWLPSFLASCNTFSFPSFFRAMIMAFHCCEKKPQLPLSYLIDFLNTVHSSQKIPIECPLFADKTLTNKRQYNPICVCIYTYICFMYIYTYICFICTYVYIHICICNICYMCNICYIHIYMCAACTCMLRTYMYVTYTHPYVIYCCITDYPNTWQLKTTNIYYLRASLGPISGYCLATHRLAQSLSWDCSHATSQGCSPIWWLKCVWGGDPLLNSLT